MCSLVGFFLPEVVIQRIVCFLFLEAHASPLIAGKSSTNMLMITSKIDGRTAKMTRFVLASLPQPDIVICSENASAIGDVSSNIGDAARPALNSDVFTGGSLLTPRWHVESKV